MPAYSPSQVNRSRTLGRNTYVAVCLLPVGLRLKPTQQILTVNTQALAGAVSVSLVSPTVNSIQAGQHLLARDADDQEYPLKVVATAASGSSTLTVDPLPMTIPANATIQFPPEFLERTGADTTENLELSETKTFNTGGFRDGIITGGSYDINLPGVYFEFCPVYRTFAEQAREGREFWFHIETAPPREGWRGRIFEGAGTVTNRSNNAPVDGFVVADFSGAFMGKPNEIPAAPL